MMSVPMLSFLMVVSISNPDCRWEWVFKGVFVPQKMYVCRERWETRYLPIIPPRDKKPFDISVHCGHMSFEGHALRIRGMNNTDR